MKKSIIAVIIVVIVGYLGWQGFHYWDTTYNGVTAYAKVESAKKVASKNNDGSNYKINGKQVYTYQYDSVTWVTTSGEVRHVNFTSAESTNPTPIATGTYVKAKISQKRVISGPNPVAASAVPTAVKTKLN